MDQIWRYAKTCEGLSSSVCCWLFLCLCYYVHATPKERLPALPDMWHDAPLACEPSMPRAALQVSCARVPYGMVMPVALGHGRSWSRTASGCSCSFAVQHKEVSPAQRSAVDAQLRDTTWQCEDNQALT